MKPKSVEPEKERTQSPRRLNDLQGVLLLLGFGILFLGIIHSHWITAPNAVYLNGSTEGVSQYLNTAWHVQRDTGLVHFSGQRFPFGEHIAYTDNQALLSSSLQRVYRNLYPLDGYSASIVNLWLLLSTLLGALFLYLLFRRLSVPVGISVWGALGIIFLSPQHAHLNGQIGLAGPMAVPLALWLLSLFEVILRRRYLSLLIGFVVWTSAQVNVFYYWLLALFLITYTFWHWFNRPSFRRQYPRILHLVAMLMLPYVLLNIWYHWSDFAVDRPVQVEAFWHNRSTFAGLFLPPDFVKNEGPVPQTYLGISASLFTLLVLNSLFRPYPARWTKGFRHRLNAPFLKASLLAGGSLLLMSVDIVSATGFKWLWNLAGPLRGLQYPAHLAWAYFYVANASCVYWFWRTSRGIGKSRKWQRLSLSVLPLLIISVEAVLWQRWIRVEPIENIEQSVVPAVSGNYQAMLPIPYYHASPADTVAQPETDFYSKVRAIGLYNGIPDLGVFQFKPSLSHSLQALQLYLEPCDYPSLLNEFPEETPLLLVVDDRGVDYWKLRKPHLLNKAKPVRRDSAVTLLSLTPDSIRSAINAYRRELDQSILSAPYAEEEQWTSPSGDPPFFYESFNSLSGSRSFQGNGAARGRFNDLFVLWEGEIPQGEYRISFWIYGNSDQGMHHHLNIQGEEGKIYTYNIRSFIQSVVDDWVLVEVPFTSRKAETKWQIFLYRQDVLQTFELDELLIRSVNQDYYRVEPEWLGRNNYWYRRF